MNGAKAANQLCREADERQTVITKPVKTQNYDISPTPLFRGASQPHPSRVRYKHRPVLGGEPLRRSESGISVGAQTPDLRRPRAELRWQTA
ncbi:hypothetical protein SRHO_G00048240 [Serrasalmus rhombeus]